MLLHYLKISFRNLTRQKVLSVINISGLSIGIACFTLFLLYTVNELNYDRFHSNSNNIFRVYEWIRGMNGGNEQASTSMPMPLAPALKQDLPEVVNAIRLRGDFGASLVRIDKNVQRLKISYTDPEFFSVFTFPIKYGMAVNPLKDKQSIVLTETKAKQLFGISDPVGRTIQIKVDTTFQPFTITAIAKDIPPNSSVRFDAMGNFRVIETSEEGKGGANNWYRSMYKTFVQVTPGSNLPANTTKLISFRKKYYPDEIEEMKKNGMKWQGNGPPITYRLQPLNSMHTDPLIDEGGAVNKKTLWILMSIASGVLLIACINFTTLAIGRSARRSKEVGVRKVVGAEKQQLIVQFLAEAFLLKLISTILGLLLANLLLPYFNQLSGRELIFSFNIYPQLVWLLIGLTLLVSLLTGIYPSLVLSNFKPIEVLKSKVRIGGANFFTKLLVTLQFALSIGLIISTVIILQQTKHMSSKHPGFNKENVVLIDASETNTKKLFPLFKHALSSSTRIAGITSAAIGLGEGEEFWVTGFKYRDKPVSARFNPVGIDYINALGMQLIAGRDFQNIAADTTHSVIINEAMMEEFGWTLNNAVGQTLDGFSREKIPVVIGVVKNFNFAHAGEKIKPQMFAPFFDPNHSKFYVRIKPGSPEKALELIETAWRNVAGGVPLQYSFLDDKLEAFYNAEKRWSNIIGWAGGISIFLACLGLLGLASLAAINRIKEIGIRKVLGASVKSIIQLLSKDFLKLVLIAFIIASPVAWYVMNKWLDYFDYRISIKWWIFIVTGAIASLIAFITISTQAIKAALSNPVKSLRME